MTRTPTHCPNCGHPIVGSLEHDKRAVKWRVRVRLYDMIADDKSPQADSDPELAPDVPGTLVCAGLKGVADVVMQLAMTFHHTTQLPGLDAKTLDAKTPGLRPTLSRRGGNAVWRLPYDTQRTFDPARREAAWMARVDLERIDATPEGTNHPTFRRQP